MREAAGDISETWIDVSDAGYIVMYWVDPRMSIGATEHFLDAAARSGMVRSRFRDVAPSEEGRLNDRPYVKGHESALQRFELVKEDLEYYCRDKLGGPKVIGAGAAEAERQQESEVKDKTSAEMKADGLWALDEIMALDLRRPGAFLRNHKKHVTAAYGLLKKKFPGNHLKNKELAGLARAPKYRERRRTAGNPHQ
jgi:hypothetical protein